MPRGLAHRTGAKHRPGQGGGTMPNSTRATARTQPATSNNARAARKGAEEFAAQTGAAIPSATAADAERGARTRGRRERRTPPTRNKRRAERHGHELRNTLTQQGALRTRAAIDTQQPRQRTPAQQPQNQAQPCRRGAPPTAPRSTAHCGTCTLACQQQTLGCRAAAATGGFLSRARGPDRNHHRTAATRPAASPGSHQTHGTAARANLPR